MRPNFSYDEGARRKRVKGVSSSHPFYSGPNQKVFVLFGGVVPFLFVFVLKGCVLWSGGT